MRSGELGVAWAPGLLCASFLAAAVGCGSAPPQPVTPAPTDPAALAVEGVPEPVPESPRYKVTDRVQIRTSLGTIVVGLYGEDAPDTVANFLSYVDQGFYSGKVFHRVIPGFMVQGGGFDAALQRAPTGAPIALEIIPGLKHEQGVVSMARTSDPHSATSQFFICVANARQLNGGYAAFAEVEEGIDVALAISTVPTHTVEPEGDAKPMEDVPVTPVVIESISRLD